MGTTQSDNAKQSLSILFPRMDANTIQDTLDEAQGDAGKAIVLLIQTPDNQTHSTGYVTTNKRQLTEKWRQRQTESKNKKAFIQQQFTGTLAVYWRILAIIFWLCVALLFILIIIFTLSGSIIHSSFSVTMCLCSVIELLFTALILHGAITYEIWCVWVTLIWSGLHGITAIYSLFKWIGDDAFLLHYVGSVVLYWILVFLCNIMYFIKLNTADARFNVVIQETSNVLKGMEMDTIVQKETKMQTQSSAEVEIQYEPSSSPSDDTF